MAINFDSSRLLLVLVALVLGVLIGALIVWPSGGGAAVSCPQCPQCPQCPPCFGTGVIADCGKLGGEISPPDPDNGEIRVLAWHDTNEDTVFSYGEVAGSGINVELVSDTIPPKAVSLPTKSNGLAVFNVPFDPAKTMQPCYTIHLMNPDFDTPHLTNNGTNPSTTVCPFISPGSVNTVHFPTRLQAAGPTPVPPAP